VGGGWGGGGLGWGWETVRKRTERRGIKKEQSCVSRPGHSRERGGTAKIPQGGSKREARALTGTLAAANGVKTFITNRKGRQEA